MLTAGERRPFIGPSACFSPQKNVCTAATRVHFIKRKKDKIEIITFGPLLFLFFGATCSPVAKCVRRPLGGGQLFFIRFAFVSVSHGFLREARQWPFFSAIRKGRWQLTHFMRLASPAACYICCRFVSKCLPLFCLFACSADLLLRPDDFPTFSRTADWNTFFSLSLSLDRPPICLISGRLLTPPKYT